MPKTLFDGMALTVEVGFSTTAGSGTVPIGSTLASITWTDITQYVRSVSTSRGRSSELDTYPTGNCQLVLDNRTRLFDPEYSAGTYYGKLTPLRPIRIQVTPSGGSIRSIFFGFVDRWPQAYSYPDDATVTVTASDAFKVLNELKLPSYWLTSMTTAAPLAWYRLSEATGAANGLERVSGTLSAQWRGVSTTFSTATSSSALITDDEATSSSFDNTKWFQAWDVLGTDTALGGIPRTAVWTASMWIQTTQTTTGNYAIFNHGNHVHAGNCGMIVSGGIGLICAQFGERGVSNTMTTFNSGVIVNDGKPHHIVLTYEYDSGTLTYTRQLYVDNVLATTTSSYSDEVDNLYLSLSLGLPTNKSLTASNNFPNYFTGSIQDFAVWNSRLSSTTISDLYKAGAGTYAAGTRTDQRITLLSNLANWMSDGTDLGTGNSTVLGVQVNGKGLLDALKEVEIAEQGRLFMSIDGKIKFVNRNAEGSGNFVTSQATFSDNPTAGQLAYQDIVLTYDDRYIFNEIRVTQPNGSSYVATDSSSQGKYFKQTLSLDNFIADDPYYLVNTAIYRLAQYKDPQMRIDELTINPRRNRTYQTTCVTLDIGDRITVNRTPQNVGSAISKTLIIEGVKHTITRDSWVTTFNTSPTLQNAPFVLDSATLGVLDTNILAY